MQPLISVIVPIYKVEAYLNECVDSILAQTYRNLEIILVDDGSPDNCPQICDSYASIDNRVKVIHKPNGGLSDARNAGILQASGEYLLFVDSDDYWIGNDAITGLVHALEQYPGTDIVFFGRTTSIGDRVFPSAQLNPMRFGGQPKNQALSAALVDADFVSHACLKLIRTDVVRDNSNYFKAGLLSEDWDWSIQLYRDAETFAAVADNFYGYRKREGSITQTFGLKHSEDIRYILDKWTGLLTDNGESRPFLGFLAYIYCCTIASNQLLPVDQRKQQRRLYKQYAGLLKYTDNPKVRKVAHLYKILGYNLTCQFLGAFLKYRPKRLR